MSLLKYLFLFVSTIFFIVELYHSLYLTAITQLISTILLLIYSTKYNQGLISRFFLFLLFFLSYPTQVFIMTIGQSTLTITTWKNNHFIFNDAQNAFVLMVSASLYFMFILIHNLFSLKFSSNSPTIQIFNFSENFLNENYMKKFSQNKNIKTSLVRSLLWIVFFILFVIIIFQNKFGWGVHGLPFYRENMFRLAGSSVYLRDFLLPGIIIVFFIIITQN